MIKSITFSTICTFLSVLFVGLIIDTLEQGYRFPIEIILIATLFVFGVFFGIIFSKEKSQTITVAAFSILFGFLLLIGYIFVMLSIFGK